MRRIVLFKGNFNYNVVNNFVDEISKSLQSKGYETITIPVTNDEEMTARIFNAFEKPVYFVIGFNGLGSDLRMDGQSLFDIYETIFIHWLVDHPALHFARIEQQITKSIVVCIDDTHCDYIEKYYPKRMTTCIEHATGLESVHDIKSYDIVFAGGIEDIDKIKSDMRPLAQYFPNLLEDIVTYSEESNFNLDAFKEDYLVKHPELQQIFNQDRVNVFAFINLVDRYFRSYKRQRLLQNILNSGYKVTYFGQLPATSPLNQYANFDMQGIIDYTELTNVFCRSKVVVNIMPNFIRGGHERLFKAMACGAVVITDVNEYILEQFDEDLIPLTMDAFEDNKLQQVLLNDEFRNQIVHKNLDKIKQYHTWANRVNKLLHTVDIADNYFKSGE